MIADFFKFMESVSEFTGNASFKNTVFHDLIDKMLSFSLLWDLIIKLVDNFFEITDLPDLSNKMRTVSNQLDLIVNVLVQLLSNFFFHNLIRICSIFYWT